MKPGFQVTIRVPRDRPEEALSDLEREMLSLRPSSRGYRLRALASRGLQCERLHVTRETVLSAPRPAQAAVAVQTQVAPSAAVTQPAALASNEPAIGIDHAASADGFLTSFGAASS